MKNNIEDIDFSFGKYSSESFHEEYNRFIEFSDYINSLSPEVRKAKGISGRNKNYGSISSLFSSFCERSEKNTALFRKSSSSNTSLINSWLSFVYEKEQFISSVANVPVYSPLTIDFLKEFTKNSINEKFPIYAPKVLLDMGVILIYEEAIPTAKVDGVVYVNSYGNPVIALSLRFNRIDNYWFTLMHELSHVLLHYDLLGSPIIDDLENESEDLVEAQADRMALDSLIPRSMWRGCEVKNSLQEKDLFSFSKEIGIHPAIVAGRVRNERKCYNIFSKVVNNIDIRELVF
ncbi:TPA: ImmA/IrrE family metallo-endopeptidase [Yersinia enterocolitica]|uniref:ImmA/IrrE family metallo-endopeptidase n=1 Tax=Yersinia enterocolitica TaxID=630 RepID=UPI002875E505|nr:ImmA/IrrE family metallo-endopeptidase [Yersinia enterocolitica]EKN6283972.1 ImmA/IrrE family metallo-endopeptidase [Yersinia enterocolitica]ELY5241948.1 ImmA/IrrE family metallo-endopeptidase [Yersinia enterocolitica]HDM8367450.1 ImmA/IrrE family metallo-endopeptidase [Yersinia enterocolitica]HDW8046596.1 ImmA/IrrE family metallo-endopeptidase [Yersinia enterocolitica]